MLSNPALNSYTLGVRQWRRAWLGWISVEESREGDGRKRRDRHSGGNLDNGRNLVGWLLPDAPSLIDSGKKASNDAAGTEADALPTELTPATRYQKHTDSRTRGIAA